MFSYMLTQQSQTPYAKIKHDAAEENQWGQNALRQGSENNLLPCQISMLVTCYQQSQQECGNVLES